MKLDYNKITNIVVENIKDWDYPDFVDAYISSADYDGREMTEDELNTLNEDSNFVYEQVLEYLY